MCRAITSLVYGVPVRTSSLVFAVDSFPHLEAPLLFFRLISLRRRKGTFGTEKPSAVERVPHEVWELIQHKLVDIELQRADERFFSEISAGTAGHGCWKNVLEAYSDDEYYWEDILTSFDAGLFAQRRGENTSKLLSQFGLALPAHFLRVILEDPDQWRSPYAATLLTLRGPALPDFCDSSLEADCGGDWASDEHALADVSLDIPADARLRFTSLIKLLHLEPLELENLSPPAISEQEGKDYPKTKFPPPVQHKRHLLRFIPVEVKDVSPRWRLSATCQYIW
ncbi:hypothetical protein JCM10213_009283 [Rhodosporidiobolus nylandii]